MGRNLVKFQPIIRKYDVIIVILCVATTNKVESLFLCVFG